MFSILKRKNNCLRKFILAYLINLLRTNTIVYLLITILLIVINNSCNNEKKSSERISASAEKNRLSIIRYAKGFDIKYFEGYKEISISKTEDLKKPLIQKYFLVDNHSQIPGKLKNIKIIRTPVQRIICLSTTHFAFVDLIGKTQTIKGISGANLVNNEKISALIKSGEIADVGYDNDLNFELILSMKPDLVIAYNILGESASYINKLEELGINVVIDAEYLEETPLAKSEWIKFISAFYNAEKIANTKFDEIAKEYNLLKNLAGTIKLRPSVITGLPWKNIWYIPGGKTVISNLISDAGGDYIYKNMTSATFFPSNIEYVFENFQNAGIWINCGTANTLNDIKLNDERLQHFKAFKEGKIFNNNAKQNASGGNDYWESGLVNPHLILKDLIHIFHPELLKNYQLTYYKKLK